VANVTCGNESCLRFGEPVLLDVTFVDPYTGEPAAGVVACGACSQPITDISDVPDNDTADSEGA